MVGGGAGQIMGQALKAGDIVVSVALERAGEALPGRAPGSVVGEGGDRGAVLVLDRGQCSAGIVFVKNRS